LYLVILQIEEKYIDFAPIYQSLSNTIAARGSIFVAQVKEAKVKVAFNNMIAP
jgi:hypothetical protein